MQIRLLGVIEGCFEIFVVCIDKQKVANIKVSVNNKSSADLRFFFSFSFFFVAIIKANSNCSHDN